MQAHIRRNYELAERAERQAENEADRDARAGRLRTRDMSEEDLEQYESAAQVAEYRVTERLNADVLALFARCAPTRYETETASEIAARRAA